MDRPRIRPTARKCAILRKDDDGDFDKLYEQNFGDLKQSIKSHYQALLKQLETKKSDELETLKIELKESKKRVEEEYKQKELELSTRSDELKLKEETFQKEMVRLTELHKIQESQIKLDVGGVYYTTSVSTLTSVPGSMLEAMFSGRHALQKNEEGRYFIDRNGKLFEYVLDYLRNGVWDMPRDPEVAGRLKREIDYYGLVTKTETTQTARKQKLEKSFPDFSDSSDSD